MDFTVNINIGPGGLPVPDLNPVVVGIGDRIKFESQTGVITALTFPDPKVADLNNNDNSPCANRATGIGAFAGIEPGILRGMALRVFRYQCQLTVTIQKPGG